LEQKEFIKMLHPILAERPLPRDRSLPAARQARSVRINLAESPLGWLKARGLLNDRQFAAGEQLRADYERGGLMASVTMRWDAAPAKTGRGGRDPAAGTHGLIDARDRFHSAVAAAGTGLSDILWRVVCAGEAVPVAEKALGWPVRSGRLVLAMALDRIADFYRLR
jgi:hypothetical protein